MAGSDKCLNQRRKQSGSRAMLEVKASNKMSEEVQVIIPYQNATHAFSYNPFAKFKQGIDFTVEEVARVTMQYLQQGQGPSSSVWPELQAPSPLTTNIISLLRPFTKPSFPYHSFSKEKKIQMTKTYNRHTSLSERSIDYVWFES